MKVKIISCVINNESFMKNFNSLITDDLDKRSLISFANLVSYPSKIVEDRKLKERITYENGKSYPLLPVLNTLNTALLAEELKAMAMEFAAKTKSSIGDLREVLADKTDNTVHSIINHFVLANLWVRAYSSLINNPYGGSLVVIDNPEECKVIYSEVIGLNSNQLAIYWQNSLQANNHVYVDVLDHKDSRRMLRSRDSEKLIMPYGVMQNHFVRLKLARTKRIKGSHVPSYFCNLPEFTGQELKEVRKPLLDLTKAGYKYFGRVQEKIKDTKNEIFVNQQHVADCHIVQAGYYVWCYAVYQEWLNTGVLQELHTVKDVLGVRQVM